MVRGGGGEGVVVVVVIRHSLITVRKISGI